MTCVLPQRYFRLRDSKLSCASGMQQTVRARGNTPVCMHVQSRTCLQAFRHPELARTCDPAKKPMAENQSYYETDNRYQRVDDSQILAHEARVGFARCIVGGEPQMRLAEAALYIAAEDDALMSVSTVPFPVQAYLKRIQDMADEVARVRLNTLEADSSQHPVQVLQVIEQYLFQEKGVRVSARTKLPARSRVDHPGVWEDARLGYLNELLVRRQGHPSAVAILYADIMQRLLVKGCIDFAVTMDIRSFEEHPRAVVLPHLTRSALIPVGEPPGAGTTLLNTCTSEVLVELLRYLKRAYWPFSWESEVDSYADGGKGSHGGFLSAAKAAAGEKMSATLAAVSKVANWRLERGIFTSPGAGDIRRCIAACERLVMMAGDSQPEERRDLAVLYMHAGRLGEARKEMQAYLEQPSATWHDNAVEKHLCHKITQSLTELNLEEPNEVLSVHSVLQRQVQQSDEIKPLTW